MARQIPKDDPDLVRKVVAGIEVTRQTIQNRTPEQIAALPTEQRWSEYGRTYEEEQAHRAANGQNPDGTYKETTINKILTTFVEVVGVGAAIAITAGIAAPSLFAAASNAVVAAGVLPEAVAVVPTTVQATAGIAAGVKAAGGIAAALTAAPSVADALETGAAATADLTGGGKTVSFLADVIDKANSVVTTISEAPAVQKAVAQGLSNFLNPTPAQQSSANVQQPTQSGAVFQEFSDIVSESSKGILDQIKKQGQQEQPVTQPDFLTQLFNTKIVGIPLPIAAFGGYLIFQAVTKKGRK